MNELEDVKEIDFGIFEDFAVSKGSMCFHSVMRINDYEYLAAAPKQMIKFERDKIKKSYDIPSVCVTYLKHYDAIIIISPPPTKMSIYFADQMNEPILKDVNVDQFGICHMVWSERNRTLITFGIGISTWLIEMVPKMDRIAKYDIWAKVTFLKHFALGYRANVLSNPCYIEKKSQIVIPLKEGLQIYSLDGEMKGSPVTLNSDKFTLYLYNEKNNKALTSDADQGLCLWNKHGRMMHHYTCISTPIFVAFYMTKEFIISYDSTMFLSIIDVKTERYFPMIKVYPRPDHIFFDRSPGLPTRVIICAQNAIKVYRVIIPWHLWKRTATKPQLILRSPRANGAARIGVLLSDASIQFFSPVSRKLLTLCHAREVGFPTCILPDRGMLNVASRDQLFVTFDNGKTAIFGTNQPLLEPVVTLDNKGTCCTLSMYMGKWCLLIGTTSGDILAYTYDKLQFFKRFGLDRFKVENIYHHDKTESIFVAYEHKTARYNSTTGLKTEEYPFENGCIGAVLGDLLVYGYENGSFMIYRVMPEKMICLHAKSRPLHIGRVTGLTSGHSFFVSSGMDGTVLIWTMDNAEVVIQLKLPLPISSVAFLNGRRGLLVGTESEIMIIDGKSLFGQNVDPEDSLFDNFDKKKETFDGGLMLLDENDNCEEEDMGFLFSISVRAQKEREEQERMRKMLEEQKQQNEKWSNEIPEIREVTVKKGDAKKGEMSAEERAALEEMKALMGDHSNQGNINLSSQNQNDNGNNENNENSKNKKEENGEYTTDDEEEDEEYLRLKRRRKSKASQSSDKNSKNNKKDGDDENIAKKKGKGEGDDDSDDDENSKKNKKSKGNKDDDDFDSHKLKSGGNDLDGRGKGISKNDSKSSINRKTLRTGLQQPSSRYNKSSDNNNNKSGVSSLNNSNNSANKNFGKGSATNGKGLHDSDDDSDDDNKAKKKGCGGENGKSKKKKGRKSKKSNTNENSNLYNDKSKNTGKSDGDDILGRLSARRRNDNDDNLASGSRNIDEYQSSNFKTKTGEFDASALYPNVSIRDRSPRRVILREKEPVSPDHNAIDHLAPSLYFDKATIQRMLTDQRPENLEIMKRLSCFNQVEINETMQSYLGDLDENSKHFVIAKPKSVNIDTLDRYENDDDIVTVLPLKEDPPPLIEVPPYIELRRSEPNFAIPPPDEQIPASSRVYPPSSPSGGRGRPSSPSVRQRTEMFNTLASTAAATEPVLSPRPKIINPATSIGRTRYGSLVKIFSQVHEKKTRKSYRGFP